MPDALRMCEGVRLTRFPETLVLLPGSTKATYQYQRQIPRHGRLGAGFASKGLVEQMQEFYSGWRETYDV